ncbi:MAG TPA: cytochrome ubiquinol oxidase subunit I [Nitrospiraceae bacterium]|nr:cytochrome ubiquinol oxidase subunit I [Nitrospiraceae bacterium]
MGHVTRKKLLSIMALGAMVGLLLMPILVSLPALASGGGEAPAGAPADAAKKEGEADKKVEKGRDVYYKIEGIVSGAPAPKTTDGEKDYPRYNFESRVLLWFANQQHLYYGSFVLAVPIFCMVIEFMGVVAKDKAMAKKYDQLAYDFIKISLTAYSLTAILGGILIFTFLTLYPAFFGYLSSIFRPVMHIYALMFVAESGTLYIYYYGWDKMKEGFLKWIHLSMSVILNVIGTVLMFLANSWIGFMMSPAGVDEQGRFLGNIWHVLHTALWNPLNVHRILGNMAFGGGVVAAYAAYRFLSAKNDEERAHYDWMGYIAMAIGVAFLIPLPFAGYWLMREVYAYRQQMGITLMGGLLAWLFIIQATMIGILFLSSNYYLWQALGRMRGAEKYQRYIKYLVFMLVVGFLVFITPHTIVMTPAELKAMGGQQHPVLGNYGVMSAKNGGINVIITTTVLSFIWYMRGNKVSTVSWAKFGNIFMGVFFALAYINIVWLAIYGYYIPANVRVGLSVPQVATTLSCLFFMTALNTAMMKGAKQMGAIEWGKISARSQYALIMLATAFTWMMGLMGYIRSSVRLFWHVNEIMRDNSPWAYTHTVGFAANMISFNVLFFWVSILFVFWLGTLGAKKAPIEAKVPVPGRAPEPAVGH